MTASKRFNATEEDEVDSVVVVVVETDIIQEVVADSVASFEAIVAAVETTLVEAVVQTNPHRPLL